MRSTTLLAFVLAPLALAYELETEFCAPTIVFHYCVLDDCLQALSNLTQVAPAFCTEYLENDSIDVPSYLPTTVGLPEISSACHCVLLATTKSPTPISSSELLLRPSTIPAPTYPALVETELPTPTTPCSEVTITEPASYSLTKSHFSHTHSKPGKPTKPFQNSTWTTTSSLLGTAYSSTTLSTSSSSATVSSTSSSVFSSSSAAASSTTSCVPPGETQLVANPSFEIETDGSYSYPWTLTGNADIEDEYGDGNHPAYDGSRFVFIYGSDGTSNVSQVVSNLVPVTLFYTFTFYWALSGSFATNDGDPDETCAFVAEFDGGVYYFLVIDANTYTQYPSDTIYQQEQFDILASDYSGELVFLLYCGDLASYPVIAIDDITLTATNPGTCPAASSTTTTSSAAASSTTSCGPVQTQLVVNPSFEIETEGSYIFPWSYDALSGAVSSSAEYPAYDGNELALLYGNGLASAYISQTLLPFIPGDPYTLTYYWALAGAFHNGDDLCTFSTSFGAATILNVDIDAAAYADFSSYSQVHVIVYPQDSEELLEFQLNCGVVQVFPVISLDDITVIPGTCVAPITKSSVTTSAAATSTTSCSTPVPNSQLVINPSFEIVTDDGLNSPPWVLNDLVAIFNEEIGFPAYDGLNYADFYGDSGSDAIISQTISGFVPGSTYTLSFYWTLGQFETSDVCTFTASFAGVEVWQLDINSATYSTYTSATYYNQELPLVSLGSTETLEFDFNCGDPDSFVALDEVTITGLLAGTCPAFSCSTDPAAEAFASAGEEATMYCADLLGIPQPTTLTHQAAATSTIFITTTVTPTPIQTPGNPAKEKRSTHEFTFTSTFDSAQQSAACSCLSIQPAQVSVTTTSTIDITSTVIVTATSSSPAPPPEETD